MKYYGTDPTLPNYARPEYVALEPDLTLISDEMVGTRAMHARSKEYIRKWGGEKVANYNIRRVCETFFEGFGRTLSAAVGMLFAKPPQVEWNQSEELIKPHWDNIDGAGTKGDVFVKRFSDGGIRDGLALILVDHSPAPEVPAEEITGETEAALNLRPLWSKYHRLQVINWMVEVVNNRATLTQLTLVEPGSVRSGRFGIRAVLRYRDVRIENGVARWTLYELTNETGTTADSFKVVGTGGFANKDGKPADFLPFAIAYTGRSDAPMESTIPLLGVAWANLAHWQLSTSLRFNSEVAGFAQPCVIGDLATDATGKAPALEIGPLVSVQVAIGGDFKWVEASGTGLERLGLLVLEKLRQIAALGMSFLQTDTRSAETAEAKRLDAAAENATLATAATGIEDAVNRALEIHAWYLGIEASGAPVVSISRDFEDTTIAADIMTAYVNAVVSAGLPVRVLLDAFQRGGRIPQDVNLDEMEAEVLAEQAAIERRKTEALEDQQRLALPPAA